MIRRVGFLVTMLTVMPPAVLFVMFPVVTACGVAWFFAGPDEGRLLRWMGKFDWLFGLPEKVLGRSLF